MAQNIESSPVIKIKFDGERQSPLNFIQANKKQKISLGELNEITKSLLQTEINGGDTWYVINTTIFHEFHEFIENEIQCPPEIYTHFIIRNDFGFIYLHQDLHKYCIQWFSITRGLFQIPREITISGEDESDPMFISCALCDDTGKPEIMSKSFVSMSTRSSLYELSNKIAKQMIMAVADKTNLIVSYWFRKTNNNKHKTELNRDPLRDPLTTINRFYTSSILEQNNMNFNDKNIRIWRKENSTWSCLDQWSCSVSFEKYLNGITNIDLWTDINIMIEIINDDGEWKRSSDENEWRKELEVGSKVDIYDKSYSHWYKGLIVELNEKSNQVKVRYAEYAGAEDEYIDINSYCIAKSNTHTGPGQFSLFNIRTINR